MSTKTATLYARIDPNIKEQAENILASLNVTASGAINLFYKQIILHNGLPFEVKLPKHELLDVNKLTEGQLYDEVMKGVRDARTGKTVPAEQFFEMLDKNKLK